MRTLVRRRVTRWPRARHALDLLLSVILSANVLMVCAARGAYGEPLLRLAPGHYVLEFLPLAAAVTAYLDARRTDTLRTRILAVCGAATAALPLGAAILESGAA